MNIDTFLERSKNIPVSLDWVDFRYSHAFSLQLSYKLFLNSLYGATGNPFDKICYCLPLAGGVTTLGKKNILLVNKFLEKKQCKIYYNDTDSSYFSAPHTYFIENDKLLKRIEINRK